MIGLVGLQWLAWVFVCVTVVCVGFVFRLLIWSVCVLRLICFDVGFFVLVSVVWLVWYLLGCDVLVLSFGLGLLGLFVLFICFCFCFWGLLVMWFCFAVVLQLFVLFYCLLWVVVVTSFGFWFYLGFGEFCFILLYYFDFYCCDVLCFDAVRFGLIVEFNYSCLV